jgi:septum formation protein
MNIILASSSQRRKQLLSWLFNEFEVIPAEVDEEKYIKLARSPEELVINLAKLKAKNILDRDAIYGVCTIISADTVVILAQSEKWQVIGKPRDRDDAVRILQTLRNKTHQVYTGICIICRDAINRVSTDFCITAVTFKNFSDKTLNNYLDQNQYLDKAGSYGIQDIKDDFGVGFSGSYTNIVGLPIPTLVNLLDKLKIPYNHNWREKVKKEFGYDS